MSTHSMNPAIPSEYRSKATKSSFISRFLDWCTAQEENRILWTGVSLATHGCIITPLTVIVIMLTGAEVPLIPFGLAVFSMVMVLITNLSALPTKITLPVFTFSILVDLAIIAYMLL